MVIQLNESVINKAWETPVKGSKNPPGLADRIDPIINNIIPDEGLSSTVPFGHQTWCVHPIRPWTGSQCKARASESEASNRVKVCMRGALRRAWRTAASKQYRIPAGWGWDVWRWE
jgi:hypothetical protein